MQNKNKKSCSKIVKICVSFLLVLILVGTIVQIQPTTSVSANPDICNASSGLFNTAISYSAPTEYTARENSATNWLKSMTQARESDPGDGSTISPSQSYKYNHTGSIEGVFSLHNSYPTHSPTPPTVYYTNLAIELYAVLDAEYLLSTISEVNANNTFHFDSSSVGTKLLRLRDTSTNEVLAEYYEPTGLIRSYQYQSGEGGYGTSAGQLTYIYDQALTLIFAISKNDKTWSDQLVDGLSLAQTKDGVNKGAFPFSVPQLGPTTASPIYRTGAQSVVTYALLKYQQKYSGNSTAVDTTQKALDYLQTMKATSGNNSDLYTGGAGRSDNPSYIVPWASTEHNIDTWHTLYLAGKVLNSQTYINYANSLKNTILSKLWNPTLQRFNQGYNDTADALDINSWGAIFLNAIGEYEKAEQALANAESFKVTVGSTTGYTPYLADRGYPGTTPTVWYEGTYEVALSHFFTEGLNGSSTIISNVINDQTAEGAWHYATTADDIYEMGTARSVASTTWYLLSSIHPIGIWSECESTASYTTDSSPTAPTPTDQESPQIENRVSSIFEKKSEITTSKPKDSVKTRDDSDYKNSEKPNITTSEKVSTAQKTPPIFIYTALCSLPPICIYLGYYLIKRGRH